MRMATFTSDQFRSCLSDSCQVNPNVLGFELAACLSRALAADGVLPVIQAEEEWGWYLEFLDGDDEYLICCSGSEEDGNYEWRVFVERRRKLFRRPAETPMQHELVESVTEALRSQGIVVAFV
jgi:hypothetical protein